MNKKKLLIVLIGFFSTQTSNASQMVMRTNSISKQRCTVQLANENQTVTYENVGTQIATFKGLHAELPVNERFQIDDQGLQRTIRFSNKALFETSMNTYSKCLSSEMAKGIFTSIQEADSYLFKTSNQSWIDVCIKNFDGFTGVCREVKEGPDGKIYISGVEKNCSGEPSMHFVLIERQARGDGFLNLSHVGSQYSMEHVTSSINLEKKFAGVSVKIICELK